MKACYVYLNQMMFPDKFSFIVMQTRSIAEYMPINFLFNFV